MNGTASTGTTPATVVERLPARDIDLSCRTPLMLFFGAGLVWLFVGTLFTLIASIKLHGPGFLAHTPWLTFGRVDPAAANAVVYGFGVQVSLGVLLWMMCRLGGMRLLFQPALCVAGFLWNLALAGGIVGILAGWSTGYEWLEMPHFAAVLMLVAYALIGWFASVGTAIIYYFVPKLLNRPLYSRQLAAFGFWTLAFLAQWLGMTRLISGPVPAWMPSVSIAAAGLMLVPLISVAMNWYLTAEGRTNLLRQTDTGRFVWFAALSYIVATVALILMGNRSAAEVTQFTYAEVGRTSLVLHGFLGMALFGALYYIVPRITEFQWPALKHVRLHFTLYAVGVALLVLGLFGAGILQGLRMNQSTADFVAVIKSTVPFVGISTLGLLLLLVGQALALKNFFTLAHRSNEHVRAYAIEFITGRETVRRTT
jgi:cytochrome c oxidase cbb3-type subunit 1